MAVGIDELTEHFRESPLVTGKEGVRWLAELPATLGALAAEWCFSVAKGLPECGTGLAAEVVLDGGQSAVLKVSVPEESRGEERGRFADELTALLLGDGRGYARVLRHDRQRRAVLIEHLGVPLGSLGLGTETEMSVIATTLQESWRPVPEPWPLPSGSWKAGWLADYIRRCLPLLPEPCLPATADRAIEFAERRAAAFEPAEAVLVHGDAHPFNVLQDPADASGTSFKLVDPEGLVSERAHDLAIPLRGFDAAGMTGVGLKHRAIELCTLLGETVGVDPLPIWEWAFVERVTTGLFIASLGGEDEAAEFLRVANELAGPPPGCDVRARASARDAVVKPADVMCAEP